MATQEELVVVVNQISENVAKVGAETSALVGKVADLEAALANNGQVTPELQAAVDALKAQVEVVDALVPDVVPPVEG